MKKAILLITVLTVIGLQLSAQRSKDVLYLKNGSIIYGKLVEVQSDQYKMQTSDGSILIFPGSDVNRFSNEMPSYDGRKENGFSFSLEGGLLIGSQNTQYFAPFSFNFLAGVVTKTRNITSLGSGVEYIGRPYTPLFIEYKHIVNERKTSPFVFLRGGGIIPIGGGEESTEPYNNGYGDQDHKGGLSFAFGTGISWAKTDYETYLSFAYRYAHTSYVQKEYGRGDVTYNSSLNRLEVKFGFKF